MREAQWIAIFGVALTLASSGASADNSTRNRDGTEGFQFVRVLSEWDLKQQRITRDEANRRDPAAATMWRDAWAAKDTEHDKATYRAIRADTAPPARER